MLRSILLFFFFSAKLAFVSYSQTYMDKVLAYRKATDEEFADTSRSILSHEQIIEFHGLAYFDVDPKYRVKAKFKAIKNAAVVTMKTSGTRAPTYKPYGTLTFKLDGKKCKLTLYQMADPARPQLNDHLLLAFTDKTNGFTTYGGGRYLEYVVSDISDEMYIDFNYCFNPYCAYVDRYSCVVPPAENHLPVAINAGVKKFHD